MAHGKHRKKKEPNYRVVAVGSAVAVGGVGVLASAGSASAASINDWDRVAQCESSGLWNRPDGDGGRSSGGLQFQPASWNDALAYLRSKGVDTSGYPQGPGHQAYKATKKQQIIAGEALLALQGPRAWTCNAMVGSPLQSSGPHGSMFKGGINPYAGDTSTPKPKPVPVTPPVGKTGGIYTVKPGDWLAKIAKAKLGAADKWRALYALNKKVIGSDPNLILPGQKLKMPGSAVTEPVQTTPKPAPKPPTSSADYVMPVQGRIGDSLLVGSGGSMSRSAGGHSGLDISAASGTPVKSAAAGKVVSMNRSGGAYGLHVVVQHSGGVYTLYAHLSAITVSMGQSVSAGQQVGRVGSTGNSGGPHLHFEVRNHPTNFTPGVFINPLTWLRSHGVSI
jgi:LysM repeat protein